MSLTDAAGHPLLVALSRTALSRPPHKLAPKVKLHEPAPYRESHSRAPWPPPLTNLLQPPPHHSFQG
jgi:hypothetical protein